MSLTDLIAEAEASRVNKSTPVKQVNWSEYQLAGSVPQLQDALAKQMPVHWLECWTYLLLPISVLLNGWSFLSAKGVGVFRAIDLAMLVILVVSIAGLEQRRLWGWKLNWVVLLDHLVFASLPIAVVASTKEPVFLPYWVGAALVVGIIWIWPNAVYFAKRRAIFS
jgi:hypothetical protein